MNSLFKTSLAKDDFLFKKFEEIHDYIYSNDGLSPQQTLEEFVKILFVKIYDENENLNQFTISATEWNELEAGKKFSSVNERISAIFEKTKEAYQDIFDKDERIKISSMALGFVVNKLQGISLLNSSQDAKGLAFQKFLSHHQKDGQGQFFTPEPIIDFCVAMMQPKPTEKIIDPACGSGGFLVSALRYLQNTNSENNLKNNTKIDTQKIVSENLFGTDINKSIARIAKMKLLLEANGKTNVICTNSLEDLDILKLNLATNNDKKINEGFDLVLANPPFGAKIKNSLLLSKFDLGYKWKKNQENYYKTNSIYSNQNAEILFIERCLQLLKEGGRMAIVLPNGNFENPSLEYLRDYIKQNSKILAVINLPQETFIPFGTGVKTSLLFLQKDSNSNKDYPIFFGRIEKLGYQGNKNGTPLYKKDEYGTILKDCLGSPLLEEDFSKMVEDYKEFQTENIQTTETENYFSINYQELNGRFDFDFYSPENRNLLSELREGKNVRLGDICDIVKLKSKKLKDQNKTVEYVELSDINIHLYEIINSTTYQVYELPSRASYEIKEGDIITAIAGNSLGTKKTRYGICKQRF